MFEIKTPGNAAFTGIRCDTAIVNGSGKTADVEAARELLALGYSVEPDPTPEPARPAAKKDAEKK